MGFNLQAKFLRVLQEQQFERLGGDRSIMVDVRVIAATNRDLAQAIADRSFREDLFYRLNVFPVHIPPLRERREDILPLAEHFSKKFSARMGRPLLPSARKQGNCSFATAGRGTCASCPTPSSGPSSLPFPDD